MSKILIDEATVKLALDAMQRIEDADMDCDFLNIRQADQLEEAITALRKARAAQPAREPLTDEEMAKAWAVADGEHNASASVKRRITRAIEAAHNIKENQS